MKDLDRIFQARGCSVAKNCYCIYYRVTNSEYKNATPEPMANRNRRWMESLAGKLTPGLIGYVDKKARRLDRVRTTI